MMNLENLEIYKHPLSDIQSDNIGLGTKVWQFSVILKGAVIGQNCNINCHTFIENDVVIGDNVTIKSGVFLWDGLEVNNNVFIGPNVTFVNNKFPRSQQYINHSDVKTVVKEFASIGANATILKGVNIGKFSMIGAGSVITKDVPDYALIYGTPAIVKGWIDENADKLIQFDENTWFSKKGQKFVKCENGLKKI